MHGRLNNVSKVAYLVNMDTESRPDLTNFIAHASVSLHTVNPYTGPQTLTLNSILLLI